MPRGGVVCSWCQGEWGCSLRIPICGAMIYEVCSTNFFVSSLHQDLACWAKCIDKYMESKHLGFVFVILTPKNLLVFNFCKEILRLTSFAQDARGGVVCSWCWGMFFSLRVSWRKAFRLWCQYLGQWLWNLFWNFLLVCYTDTWHVERNVSLDTWSRNISDFIFVILTPKNLLVFFLKIKKRVDFYF